MQDVAKSESVTDPQRVPSDRAEGIMNKGESIQMALALAAQLETEARQAQGDALALLSAIKTSRDVDALEKGGITTDCMETFGLGKAFGYIVNYAAAERPIPRDKLQKKFGVAIGERAGSVSAYTASIREAYHRRLGATVLRIYAERSSRGDDIGEIILDMRSQLNRVVGL